MKEKYLNTLLLYYEEEIMGEGYFLSLSKHFTEKHQKEKMVMMAEVERYAAKSVMPLLQKYKLQPRPAKILHTIGEEGVKKIVNLSWIEFIQQINDNYPNYLIEFAALEALAPSEDLPLLKILTNHEIAAIEFAELELAGVNPSIKPLLEYMKK